MKIKLVFIAILAQTILFAQPNTEVYLFDLVKNDSTQTYSLENAINISDNKGFYDNQPSFLNDGKALLFASTRNDQTDIAIYDIEAKTKDWLTNTPSNEYSPQQTPNKKFFSAIRLEKDGTQLLWHYSFRRKKPKVLIENLKVGYHVWLNQQVVVSFVLGDPARLEASNLKYKIPNRKKHWKISS